MIKKLIVLFLTIICIACGTVDTIPTQSSEKTILLQTKLDIYSELAKVSSSRDEFGLFRENGSIGDSILFSCLYQYATGDSVNALQSFDQNGRPLRHPLIQPGISKTPISRDMIDGFLLCALSDPKGVEITTKIIQAGKNNLWDLCGPAKEYNISRETRIGTCIMSPSLIKTIYKVHKKLGGECNTFCESMRTLPDFIPSAVSGFERHLAALHIFIRSQTGPITEQDLQTLKTFTIAEPNNALYLAIYTKFISSDQSKAIDLLLNSKLFPPESLPSTDNYCTPYIYQRDEADKDWAPCPTDEPKEHSGIDFLLAASIILNK